MPRWDSSVHSLASVICRCRAEWVELLPVHNVSVIEQARNAAVTHRRDDGSGRAEMR